MSEIILKVNDTATPSPKEKVGMGLQLISDEVQEIISYRPHWFIRRGNFIFLAIILLMLSLSFIIKYPDIIKTSVHLSAVNAPKMLEAKAEGRLEKLLIKNGDNVSAGQLLAYTQSTGNHEQVIALKKWIIQTEAIIETGKYESVSTNQLPQLTDLGEVQSAYQDFLSTLKETEQIFTNGYYQKKKNALEKDLQYLSSLKGNAYDQQKLLLEDQALQKKEFEAYEKLAKEKVIAPLELNQYKSKFIAKEQSLSQTQSQITNSDINSHNKRKELLDLEKTIYDQQQKFQSSLFNLKSHVEEWIQRYVVTASENGRLEFIGFLQEKQLLAAGQPLFFIQPPQTDYFAEMKAGQAGFGKIKQGQKVIMRMYGFPEAEFGIVEGRVSYISNIPNERDSFLVKVDLPNGLITNYNKTIFFRNGLGASAEVIADDRRLIDRFFGQMREIIRR